MAIELKRFLALTMALATGVAVAAGCVVTDDDDQADETGGASSGGRATGGRGSGGDDSGGATTGGVSHAGAEPGGAQASGASAGVATVAGAANAGTNASGAAAGGAMTAGEGGADTGGASPGGASPGGASPGGAATTAAAGAAGAASGSEAGAGGVGACVDDDPSFEGIDCETGFPTTDCSLTDPSFEGYLNHLVTGCERLYYGSAGFGSTRSAVMEAAAACMAEITEDPCSDEAAAAVALCKTEAAANVCENPLAVAACGGEAYTDQWGDYTAAGILDSCPELATEDCVAALSVFREPIYATLCMDPSDPSGEDYFDPGFTGSCVERFKICSGI
ncbi:MAG: hypothetical protein JW751_11575 [Polyangiaceae bacterium]|nr:hypothetical protein [Polyangiaceae bacterium]